MAASRRGAVWRLHRAGIDRPVIGGGPAVTALRVWCGDVAERLIAPGLKPGRGATTTSRGFEIPLSPPSHNKKLLPARGRAGAIDATAAPAYSNPRRPSDPEAARGRAPSAPSANKEGKEFCFGFKSQTMADAEYALPLFPAVTPGNRNDSPELRPLVEKAKDRYPWLQPRAAIADRGYDSAANHRFLYDQHGLEPVIPIRKPSNARLYPGLYTHTGIPPVWGRFRWSMGKPTRPGILSTAARRRSARSRAPSGAVSAIATLNTGQTPRRIYGCSARQYAGTARNGEPCMPRGGASRGCSAHCRTAVVWKPTPSGDCGASPGISGWHS